MAEEYISGTLKEIAIGLAKKQEHMVNTLLEDTQILDLLRFEPSSHGLWNTYEEVTHIGDVETVDMNAPLPKATVDSKLKKVDLHITGAELEAGEDTIVAIGKDEYFGKKIPLILKQAGMHTEKNIIYDNIRQFAIDKGKAEDAGGTGTGFSMIAFREIPGENIGLYDANGLGSRTLLDVKAINDGALYKNEKGVLVYGMRLKGYLGYQLANKNGVAAIVNIDKDHLPTEEMIDDMILSGRADTGSRAFIMCHPRMLSFLNKYKASVLQTNVTDRDLNRTIDTWNKVKIITSYSFEDGTEPHVTL